MKKTTIAVIALLLAFGCLTPSLQMQVSADSFANTSINELAPRKDILEWRYKTINGKLYKRLYNISQDKWVGDWILVK